MSCALTSMPWPTARSGSRPKADDRLLIPLTAADQAQAPPELRAALAAITGHVDDYATRARLPRAA